MSAVLGVCNYQRRCLHLYFSHLHFNVFLCSFCIWLPPPTTTQSCGFWAGKESAEPNTFIPVNNHPLDLRWTVNTCTTRFPFTPWKNSNFQTWVACYRISFDMSGNRRNFSSPFCMNNRQRDEDNSHPPASSGLLLPNPALRWFSWLCCSFLSSCEFYLWFYPFCEASVALMLLSDYDIWRFMNN